MATGSQPDDTAFPERHYPAHPPPVERHNEPIILHVSVCVRGRRHLLANRAAHEALCQAWARTRNWCVGYYLIMPDHVHLFCAPAVLRVASVKCWVKYWKRQLSRRRPALRGVWQPDCWDTQMRSASHYLRKLEYVRSNSVRAGLVVRQEDWPFQGVMHDIRW